jgi:Flp pilus assembly pilin Flp
MEWLRRKLGIFIEDERGQTAVEYMLIIAVLVGVIFTLRGIFMDRFSKLVKGIFDQIDRKVQKL